MNFQQFLIGLFVLAAKLMVALPIVCFGVAICLNMYWETRLKYVMKIGGPFVEGSAKSQEEHES